MSCTTHALEAGGGTIQIAAAVLPTHSRANRQFGGFIPKAARSGTGF